jgi:hypothetical protein
MLGYEKQVTQPMRLSGTPKNIQMAHTKNHPSRCRIGWLGLVLWGQKSVAHLPGYSSDNFETPKNNKPIIKAPTIIIANAPVFITNLLFPLFYRIFLQIS